MLRFLSKPIRTVLRWQFIATVVLAAVAAVAAGPDGALSAALGLKRGPMRCTGQ